jgi:hypothetical protein
VTLLQVGLENKRASGEWSEEALARESALVEKECGRFGDIIAGADTGASAGYSRGAEAGGAGAEGKGEGAVGGAEGGDVVGGGADEGATEAQPEPACLPPLQTATAESLLAALAADDADGSLLAELHQVAPALARLARAGAAPALHAQLVRMHIDAVEWQLCQGRLAPLAEHVLTFTCNWNNGGQERDKHGPNGSPQFQLVDINDVIVPLLAPPGGGGGGVGCGTVACVYATTCGGVSVVFAVRVCVRLVPRACRAGGVCVCPSSSSLGVRGHRLTAPYPLSLVCCAVLRWRHHCRLWPGPARLRSCARAQQLR